METRDKTADMDIGTRPNPGSAAPHNDPDRVRQDMKQAGETLREEARATGEQIRSSVTDAGRQAKEKVTTAASQVAEQTQRKAAEYAKQAQTQGAQMLDQQRTRAAEGVHTLGEAVRRAAGKFREDHDDNIAGYVDAAADEVQRLGDYLQQRDLASLWQDTQSFGRRRPELFLGGMFVAGLALTRFLKASAERQQSQSMQSYQGGQGRGYRAPRFPIDDAADPSHRLPDPAHATHEFTGGMAAGASGTGGAAGSASTYTAPATVDPLGTSATLGSTGLPTLGGHAVSAGTGTASSPSNPTTGSGPAQTQPEVY